MNDKSVLEYAKHLLNERESTFSVIADGTDSYRYETAGSGTASIAAGSARGVLYAVYDILAGKKSADEKPAFSIRGINPCESLSRHTPEQLKSLLDRMGRWRMNTLIIHSLYGFEEHKELLKPECEKRGIELVHYTYYNLSFCGEIPREYFSRKSDSSIKPAGHRLKCSDRLCASNAKGLQLYGKGVRDFLEGHRDYDNMIFATSDGYNYCECADCAGKNPIMQWQPFFDIFYDNATDRVREALIYVNRFSVPGDMSRIGNVDRILFDTHLRYRRAPLESIGIPDRKKLQNSEAAVDCRAKGQNINNYLFDRLVEWRKAFSGKLYVFENLMLQGVFGVSEPNTRVYLDDIRSFYRNGIDGVVYEAYEPGIKSFSDKLDKISEALWNPYAEYTPSAFELKYLGDLGVSDVSGVSVSLADSPDSIADDYWDEFRCNNNKSGNFTLAKMIYRCRNHPSRDTLVELLEYITDPVFSSENDWLLIGFFFIKHVLKESAAAAAAAPAASILCDLSPLEESFISNEKLWDFMAQTDNPRAAAKEAIFGLLHKIRASRETR